MAAIDGDGPNLSAGADLPKLVFKDYEGLERCPFAAWGRHGSTDLSVGDGCLRDRALGWSRGRSTELTHKGISAR